MLLSADLFSWILDGRKVTVDEKLPTAFSSIFGWVLIGLALPMVNDHYSSLPVSLTVLIEYLIENFWKVEEPAIAPVTFTEEGQCEKIFYE